MLQVAVHWLCLNPGWRHTFSVRHLASATSSVRQRHWSLFSTYWRFTSQIIIIIIIIYIILSALKPLAPTNQCYATCVGKMMKIDRKTQLSNKIAICYLWYWSYWRKWQTRLRYVHSHADPTQSVDSQPATFHRLYSRRCPTESDQFQLHMAGSWAPVRVSCFISLIKLCSARQL